MSEYAHFQVGEKKESYFEEIVLPVAFCHGPGKTTFLIKPNQCSMLSTHVKATTK